MFLPDEIPDPYLTIFVVDYSGKLQIDHPLVENKEKLISQEIGSLRLRKSERQTLIFQGIGEEKSIDLKLKSILLIPMPEQ